MAYSIGQLCKEFNLARSTLLYYDTIGLLRPPNRGSNNYRIYSQEDVKLLQQIFTYRQTGIALKEIKCLLDASDGTIKKVLEKRLDELNEEMNKIRNQQHLILTILRNEELLNRLHIIEKDTLIEILKLAGLDDDDLDRVQVKLEEMSPEGQQIFLEALGIDKEKIKEIREYARHTNNKQSSLSEIAGGEIGAIESKEKI